MMAYFLGGSIVCGALVSWWLGPTEAPALLARWLPPIALALFVVFAMNAFLFSEVLAALAGLALSVVLGFFAGGLTQAAGMAFAHGGLRATGNWRAVLLVVCVWAVLLTFVGVSLRG